MKAVIAIVISLALGYFAFSFFKPVKEKPKAKGVTWYYPKSNIYYTDGDGKYYYLGDGEKWVSTTTLSEEQKSVLGDKVLIAQPQDPVWKNNDEHRMIYSVSLYTSAPDIKKKYYEDSLNSLPKKMPPTAKTDKEEKPEAHTSGLKKFFEKIFKGKKKEKE